MISSCDRALDANKRVLIEDIETWAEMAGAQDLAEYRRCGLRALQSTPLASRDGRPLGMISTRWREVHRSQPTDFDLFDVLARQAADLIERGQSESALHESEERHRALFERSTETSASSD